MTEANDLANLPLLPRDDDGPVFVEPWQAQAFALAVKLSEQGYFTWKEWAGALADELKTAADRGEPDDANLVSRGIDREFHLDITGGGASIRVIDFEVFDDGGEYIELGEEACERRHAALSHDVYHHG